MTSTSDLAVGWRGMVAGFGLLAVGEVLARLLGLASTILMARVLGPDGFGLVALGTTLVAWTALGVDAGTELLAVRDLGRDPARLRTIAEPLLGLRLAMALTFMSLAVGAGVAVGGMDAHVLSLFALALPALALNPRFMAVAVRASGAVAIGNVAGQVVLLAGVLVLVGTGDVATVPLLIAGGELAYASVVFGVLIARIGPIRPRVVPSVWRTTLRQTGSLFGYSAARAVAYSADLLLIGLLLGHVEAGQYGAAYKPVLFVSGGLGLFYWSFLASHGRGDASDRRRLVVRTLRTVPPVVLAGTIALSASAPLLVSIMYGDGFEPAAAALAILAWTLPLQAWGGVYTMVLIAGGRQHSLLRNNVAGAAANVLANLAVIPTAGISGAAVATVVTEMGIHLANRWVAVAAGLAPASLRPAA